MLRTFIVFVFAVAVALGRQRLPTEEADIIREAQAILLKETNSVKFAFSPPKSNLSSWMDFADFMEKHSKYYSTRDELYQRFRTFRVNMYIASKIQEHERGSARYGATIFADIPVAEFKRTRRGPTWFEKDYPETYADIPSDPPPESFDWRERGAVTPVKNQGSCGSCWAFSVTGNIEGQWFIKKKELVSLSEQELVDCDKIDQGCNGGLPQDAYKEIMRMGGLEREKDYPYEGRGETCVLKKQKIDVYINDSVKISKDEGEMASWLAQNGPISIGINAMPMQFYFGGISHPYKFLCNPKDLDHGVLIAGYGVKKGEPFWIIKNSWGPHWGESGYYLIYRGDGSCGLNQMCTSAVVK